MDNKLSTGQEYNPVVKEKLKETFSKDGMKSSASKGVAKVGKAARYSAATGAGHLLDAFVGEWAGDWMKSKAVKDPKAKPGLKASDYLKIVKLEIAALLGKYTEQKKEEPEKPAKKEKTPPISVSPPVGLAGMGVNSRDDLETLIKEMKKTSEEELLKYIEQNNITNNDTINDLIEAVNAANNEVEKGLRNQLKLETGDSKTLERIAKNTDEIKTVLSKKEQDTYKAEEEKKKSNAPASTEEKKKDSDWMSKLSSVIGPIGTVLSSIGGAIATGLGALVPLLAPLAVIAGTAMLVDSIFGNGGKLDKEGLKEGGRIDSASKALGGNGTRPDAAKSDVQLMEDKTKSTWFGKSKTTMINEIQKKIDLGQEFSQGEADVIKKNLDFEVPKSNIKAASAVPAKADSPQQALSKDMQSNTADVADKKDAQSSTPVIVQTPMPVQPAAASKDKVEVLNYDTQNGDNTFRRLNEKSFGLAFI